jgi:integrase
MARMKLTKPVVEAATAVGKPLELWDTIQKGLVLKVTPPSKRYPAGQKIFMVAYRAADGTKRKPRIGVFGAITLEQAREAARVMLSLVTLGGDPSAKRQHARGATSVAELCDLYIREVAEPHSKPSYLKQQKRMVEKRIKPAFGPVKAAAITRADIQTLHNNLKKTPYEANRVLALLSVIFRHAEVRGMRPEGSNPCRLVKKYREKRRERLLTDHEVARIFDALKAVEQDETEPRSLTLAIRLLFATASRASEVLGLRWDYIDREANELVWPDSKTGRVSKPMTEEVKLLLSRAERIVGNPYVCYGPDKTQPVSIHALEKVWRRILRRAGVTPCGLHGIRHRAATEIANSGVPIQVGMKLIGHKTAATYLRYLHTDREQTLQAAEHVSRARASRLATVDDKLKVASISDAA